MIRLPDIRNRWLRPLNEKHTPGSWVSFEWAWLFTQLAVVSIALATAYLTNPRFDGLSAVYIGGVVVLLYSIPLAFLLFRKNARTAFYVAFVLDNLIIAFAWWQSVNYSSEAGLKNDLWLVLLPMAIIGVATTDRKFGLLYIGGLISFLVSMTMAFEPADSHASEQLPLHVVFLAMVGFLSTWLVAGHNHRRESAKQLRSEADTIGEIDQLISSTFDPSHSFSSYSSLVRQMIPYDVLIVAVLSRDEKHLEVLSADASPDSPLSGSATIRIGVDEKTTKHFRQLQPELLDQATCNALSTSQDEDGDEPLAGFQSMAVAGLVSASRSSGVLLVGSESPGKFNESHLGVLKRIGELIGTARANMQAAAERQALFAIDAENRKLEEDSRERYLFLSAVSHELRTPLESIVSFNDLVLRNRSGNLDEKQIKYLELVRRNGKHLSDLLTDLLDMSNIQSTNVKLVPEIFRPSEAIGQIAASIAPMLRAKQQKLTRDPEESEATVFADPQRFSQVVSNILSNASKYSPDKSAIELSWSISDGNLVLVTRDHGIGISKEDQTRLFQPFFRARQHKQEKVPGTGLGLFIIHNLLEAHGGGISIKSSQEPGPEQGTEVRIWFPADGSGFVGDVRSDEVA